MKAAWLQKIGLIITLLLFAGCAPKPESDPLENTRWVLTGVGSVENPTELIPGTVITAVFQTNHVSGTSGCNQYGAAYTIRANQIKVPEIESTAVDCPSLILEQESQFINALHSATRFTLMNEVLVVETAVTPLIFIAIDAEALEGLETAVIENPLAGATWQLVALETPDGPLPIRDVRITAQFDADNVHGNGGCNPYAANIHLAADAYLLLLNSISHGFNTCIDAVNQQEAIFFRLMETAESFTLAEDTLIIFSASGILNFKKVVD
jgi:heat shock protein HslJ